jgi:hypothetical protein
VATLKQPGTSLAETALIISLIAVFCIVSLTGLANAIVNVIVSSHTALANAIMGAVGSV